MTREQFLRELRLELRQLSFEEEENIIEEYVSIFNIEQEKGLSDEEIINNLGNPKDIAKLFIDELDTNKTKSNNKPYYQPTNNTALFVVMLIIDVVFIQGIYIVYIATVFGISISSIACFIAPIIYFFSFTWTNIFSVLVVLFISFGIGLLLMSLSILATKFIVFITKKHISWMKSLINKGDYYETC